MQNISVVQWKCCSIFFLQQFWGQTSLLNQEEVLLPLVFPNHCCFAVSRSYHKYNEGDTWNIDTSFLPILFSPIVIVVLPCQGHIIKYNEGDTWNGLLFLPILVFPISFVVLLWYCWSHWWTRILNEINEKTTHEKQKQQQWMGYIKWHVIHNNNNSINYKKFEQEHKWSTCWERSCPRTPAVELSRCRDAWAERWLRQIVWIEKK